MSMSVYDINIPRGTSFSFGIVIQTDNGTEYELQNSDLIRFGVKKSTRSSTFLIYKTLTSADYDTENECYVLNIVPDDTIGLTENERYFYDIGLQTAGGDYYMIIPASRFNVMPAVTERVTT